MPSVDPQTGKRYSGAKQRRYKRERAALVPAPKPGQRADIDSVVAQLPIPPLYADLQPPPVATGVDALEAWAADLQLRTAIEAADADAMVQVRLAAVGTVLQQAGKIRARAETSAKVVKLRKLRLFDGDDLALDRPPVGDPVAAPLWAFVKLCGLAYAAATDPAWLPSEGLAVEIKSLAAIALLPCRGEQRRIVAAVKAQG